MEHLLTWMPSALDGLLIILLAVVLWRLGHDPTAAWRAREETLREIFEGLRTTVAQAEGLARDLDTRLEEHQAELRSLMRTAARATGAATDGAARVAHGAEDPGHDPDDRRTRGSGHGGGRDGADTAVRAREDERDPLAHARRLAAAGLDVDEIVRRVAVSPAEARVLAALGGGTVRPANGRVPAGAGAERQR